MHQWFVRKNTAHSHFYLAGDLLTAVFHSLNTVTQPQEYTYSEKGVRSVQKVARFDFKKVLKVGGREFLMLPCWLMFCFHSVPLKVVKLSIWNLLDSLTVVHDHHFFFITSSLSPDLRKPFLFCNYISENCILMPTWIERQVHWRFSAWLSILHCFLFLAPGSSGTSWKCNIYTLSPCKVVMVV